MNRYTYAWLIEKKFPGWKGDAEYVIQDCEKCLRRAEPPLNVQRDRREGCEPAYALQPGLEPD